MDQPDWIGIGCRGLVIATALVLSSPAVAASYAVDVSYDSHDAAPGDAACADAAGRCSLRAALEETNALAGADWVGVPAGVYGVDSSLEISDSLMLIGVTTASTVVDGGAFGPADGWIIDVDSAGGEIEVELIRLTIGGNAELESGGGVRVEQDAVVSLYDVEISGNATSTGGGLLCHGVVRLERCTVTSNHAFLNGGGVAVRNGGTAHVINSTISGNRARGSGAGFMSDNGETYLRDTTVTANVADSDDDGSGRGGGLLVVGSGWAELSDTIVAGNSSLSTVAPDVFGTVVTADFNLIGDTSGATLRGSGAHDLLNVDPQLGPLADNGGQTRTHLPAAGSPVVDAGNPASLEAADQRQVPRPQGACADIGAVEVIRLLFEDGFESGDLSAWSGVP